MKKQLIIVIVHISIWLALITLPLMMNGQALASMRPGNHSFVYGPFFFFNFLMIGLFYLNYFVLIPKFLFKKKYVTYFLLFGLLFVVMNALPEIGRLFEHRRPPMPRPQMDMDRGRHVFLILHTNSFLMYAAVFAASIALRMNNRLSYLEKEKVAARLSYLKSQVNPHFLFNTLNSIYAVTLKTEPQGAEMISRLSEIMRYNMKEAQMDKVRLSKELENLTNYIELQKVRINDNVHLRYTYKGDFDAYEIAPLLLLPFVENAFKYGVNSEEESIINVEVELSGSTLRFLVQNTKVNIAHNEDEGGIGISNTRNRLDFIYPNRHKLAIDDGEESFEVSLEIQLI